MAHRVVINGLYFDLVETDIDQSVDDPKHVRRRRSGRLH